MLIPDSLRKCVCFLCVRPSDAAGWRYGGTAFFIGLPSDRFPDVGFGFLVTAKHCVEAAKRTGSNLHARINLIGGTSRFLEIRSEWIYSEDSASDVAVIPIQWDQQWDQTAWPLAGIMTQQEVTKREVGIGDELLITGLFTEHFGRQRNLPIIRSGIICCMPDEPLEDQATREPYNAYLMEARSIGGLSGSPVFIIFQDGVMTIPASRGFRPYSHTMMLLGMIRGHWDLGQYPTPLDFGDEALRLNTGIAIVTPSQDIISTLNQEELVKLRKKKEQEIADSHAPTMDSEFETNANPAFTRKDFMESLKKVSRRVPPLKSDKGKK